MARKKIREATAKALLKRHHRSLPASFASVNVTSATNWEQLAIDAPWLLTSSLVVKPDMLFGQRGKHDLVALNVSYAQAQTFVEERANRPVTLHVGGKPVTDLVTTFIIEPFVPHQGEYYLSIQSYREHTSIFLSPEGGVNIEENWGAVAELKIPVGDALGLDDARREIVDERFGSELQRAAVWAFVTESFRVFEDLDFSMMEFNPFCCVGESTKGDLKPQMTCIPLDMRGELDDQAAFKNQKKWLVPPTVGGGGDDVHHFFPKVFGHENSPDEDYVAALDAQTGASLKLRIINPAGRVWLLVAGGGASVIFTDTVCDLGFSKDLGNYGEYSGNPTDADTYEYTKTLLKVATRLDPAVNPNVGRILLIGGGIANFTDVKATFRGICRALLDFAEPLQAAMFKIFVRRGGPNYEAALQMMKEIEPGVGVPIEVFGPDVHMTRIVHLGTQYISQLH